MRNVTVKQKGEKRTKSKVKVRTKEKRRDRKRERDRHRDGGDGGGAVSWSVDRSPEVVIYSSVSISQQQLQPSFFISLHSLRTERYVCPSEQNRHSR